VFSWQRTCAESHRSTRPEEMPENTSRKLRERTSPRTDKSPRRAALSAPPLSTEASAALRQGGGRRRNVAGMVVRRGNDCGKQVVSVPVPPLVCAGTSDCPSGVACGGHGVSLRGARQRCWCSVTFDVCGTPRMSFGRGPAAAMELRPAVAVPCTEGGVPCRGCSNPQLRWNGTNRLPPARLVPGWVAHVGLRRTPTVWVFQRCALPGATDPRLNWPVALGEPRRVNEAPDE